MVKTWPWTDTVPERGTVEVLGLTANETVAPPDRLPPRLVIQSWEVAGVHEQPLAAVTVKLALPPAAGTLAEPGERL
jgi:hypothetical protein